MYAVSGINHITLEVKDRTASLEFYADKLGFTNIVVGDSLWFQVGEQFIHVTENPEYSTNTKFNHISIEVEHLDEYLTELIAKGVTVYGINNRNIPIPLGKVVGADRKQYFVKDPDNYLIEFIEADNQFFHP